MKGIISMSEIKLLKGADGQVLRVLTFESVNRDELVAALDHAKAKVTNLENALSEFDSLSGNAQDAQAAQPADAQAQPVEQPVVAEEPAQTDPTQQPQVVTVTDNTQPVVDPNAVPAVDPNQAPAVDQTQNVPTPITIQ